MRKCFVLVIFTIPKMSLAFFGAEAESTRAYKIIEGGLAGSIIVDDLRVISENGVDYTELESLAIQHSKQAARLKGESEEIAGEYERIRYMDQYNSRSSEATKALKRASALYTSLCAFSPESCGLAAQHVGNKRQQETTKAIQEMQISQVKKDIREEIEKQKEKERKIKSMKAINDYPKELFQKILSFGSKK